MNKGITVLDVPSSDETYEIIYILGYNIGVLKRSFSKSISYDQEAKTTKISQT